MGFLKLIREYPVIEVEVKPLTKESFIEFCREYENSRALAQPRNEWWIPYIPEEFLNELIHNLNVDLHNSNS